MATPSLADFEIEDQELIKSAVPRTAKQSKHAGSDYHQVARQAATQYGLDPNIFERQINQESGFNPRAHSPAGAQGIAQIMPATAKGWHVDPNDPNAALNAAAKNMASYVKTYGGDYAKALAAYNAGPGAVSKYGGVPPYKETQNYVNRIMGGKSRQYSGASPVVQKANRAALAKAHESISVSNFELSPEEAADISQFVAGIKPPKPLEVEKPEPSNFFSDLSGGFQNALSGYTRDDLVRNSGGGIGAGLGNIGGSLVDIGGAGLAGAGLGSIIPGVGTAVGGTAGLVTGGAGLGALQEAQRERLAGEQYNPLKLVGAGAIGGITSFPVGGAASTLAKTVLKNAAIDAGINTAGDIGLQAVEKGTLDPRQLDIGRAAQAAGLGAVGGALSGWHAAHGKLAETHPVIAEKLTKGETLTPAETRVVGQVLTPDEVQTLQEGFRQRTVGKPASIITQPFDEAKAVRDLGLAKPVEEQLGTDTGLSVIREGQKKQPAPAIQVDRGLPSGRVPEPEPIKPNIINPITGEPYPTSVPSAKESAQAIKGSIDDVKTAQKIRDDAVKNLQKQSETILKQTKTPTLEEGQRAIGSRINELETKGVLTPEEGQELLRNRELFDGYLDAVKQANEAESLLKDTQTPQSRSDLGEATYQPPQRELTAKELPSDLGQARDLGEAFRPPEPAAPRVELQTPRKALDLGQATKTEPTGLLDAQGRVMGEQRPVRDLAGIPQKTEPAQLVDSSGRPMDLAAKQKDLTTPAPQAKPGAFTDTLNELLKDSGLDWQGVKQLKNDSDMRRAQAGGLKGTRTEEARRVRAELKELNDRWKALPENVREAAGVDFDTETGAGRQRAVDTNTQFTIDQVRQDLDAHSAPLAESLAQAMQKGTKARIKYVGEQTGRSHEAAKLSKGGRAIIETTEFSPTHFGYYNATYGDGARKVPAVFGYNQRGHEVGYYLNKSPKGSMLQQVVSVTDKPAFKGAIPNVAQGAGEFSMTDMLARGPRTERGFVKTSDAIRAIHEQKVAIRQVMENVLMPTDAKQTLKKALSAQDFGYDDIQKLRKTMSNPSILAEFCSNMGLK